MEKHVVFALLLVSERKLNIENRVGKICVG